jgi:hypothetical protein
MTVEWRVDREADAILTIDPFDGVEKVVIPDAAMIKEYLSVAATLDSWQTWNGWQSVEDNRRDPEAWGDLVMERAVNGDVLEVDPELFWERIYRWFRSRKLDYSPPSGA